MATDWRARASRLALPAGLAWLLLLVVLLVRPLRLVAGDLARTFAIGGGTLADRMSQLRPWPWKAPLAVVALSLFALLVVGSVAAVLVAATRRALAGDREPSD